LELGAFSDSLGAFPDGLGVFGLATVGKNLGAFPVSFLIGLVGL
jgi:hypothetical protein